MVAERLLWGLNTALDELWLRRPAWVLNQTGALNTAGILLSTHPAPS
jgi:hypothetical protein